jgi:hypothetical protein
MKISFTLARSFKKQLQQLFQKKNTQSKGTKMEGLTYCTTTPKDMQSKISTLGRKWKTK